VEPNPGPGVEADIIVQVQCSSCNKNLRFGAQCDTCGRWLHNSCGNVKCQTADSEKWCCDRCRWEKLHHLEVKLQIALEPIENLKWKNKGLEDQLREVVAGREACRRDTARRQVGGEKCLVLDDSIIRKVKTEHMSVLSVRCFPSIRTE
jgi:hypothetical protein